VRGAARGGGCKPRIMALPGLVLNLCCYTLRGGGVTAVSGLGLPPPAEVVRHLELKHKQLALNGDLSR
jgi:hypothetical protein